MVLPFGAAHCPDFPEVGKEIVGIGGDRRNHFSETLWFFRFFL
jgi:hypothetical protein